MVTKAIAQANVFRLAGSDGTDPLTAGASFYKHSPVLDDGEINEIEQAFKDMDERSAKVLADMVKRDPSAGTSFKTSVGWVKDRHDEIVSYLRRDREGNKRHRWE